MMTTNRWPWLATVVVACVCFSGCGGDPTGPGGIGPDRSGVGSGSLRVDATVSADPSAGERATSAGELETHFEIDVRDGAGVDVIGAVVIVDSALGPVTLGEGGCGRRYCGRQLGYAPTYELSVTRGADYVDDVRLTGPGFHAVSTPAPGSTVDATLPLNIAWSASGNPDSATLETRETSIEVAGDTGSYTLPAGTLRTRDDRPEDERVRVRRRARLALTGVLPGSELAISIRNGVEFFTAVAP